MMDVWSLLSKLFQSPLYQRLTASSCSFLSWSTLLGRRSYWDSRFDS